MYLMHPCSNDCVQISKTIPLYRSCCFFNPCFFNQNCAFMTGTVEAGSNESDESVEAWWERFLKQKLADDELDVELRSAWENCVQRRAKFAQEVKRIMELYQPIEKLLNSTLKSDREQRGQSLYREWGKIRRKECLLAYYDNDTFRATYTRQRYINSSTSFLQALVYRIIPENPDVEVYLRDHVSRIISIGVGPGPDIAAYLAYARCRGFTQRIIYFAIDQCAGWGNYLAAFDRQWSSEYQVSVWFKSSRFNNRDDVETLPDADMVVFSFANTALMASTIWPLLQQRYRFIIVLDGIKEVVVDSFLNAGFKDITLTERTKVYYHFNGILPLESSITLDHVLCS
ncbi:unnamed protein product [Schistosoma intercalatum]|nr:unnamed protein product [Schistosoma intercalatum]